MNRLRIQVARGDINVHGFTLTKYVDVPFLLAQEITDARTVVAQHPFTT